MKLRNLGFDNWFEEKRKESGSPEYPVARVSSVNRNNYTLKNEKTEVNGELSGRLRFSVISESDLPAVGDWVVVNYFNSNTFAVIEHVLPRKTVIRRKIAGKRVDYQTIAANVDIAFIVQSCGSGLNPHRLERYLASVHEGGAEPVMLLSKSDLVLQPVLDKIISDVQALKGSCTAICYSIKSGMGLDRIYRILEPGKTVCLLGSSGVGKTTLINHMLGTHELSIGEVRQKDGKGKHTTTRRQLILLQNNSILVDTPGLREFGNIDIDAGLGDVFPEIEKRAGGCRFKDCSHTKEVGCLVIEALEKGDLGQDRYDSYMKLRKESDYNQMSYAQKRKKDRKLGQFYKSVMKSKHSS